MSELVFLPETESLVALSWDGVLAGNTAEDRALNLLQIWDLRTRKVSATASGIGTVRALGVATGAGRCALINMDGQLSVRSIPAFESKWTVNAGAASHVAVARDGAAVLVADGRGSVRIFDGATGKQKWTQKVFEEYVMDLDVSPSGRYFAAGSTEASVPVFDLRKRSVVTRVKTATPTEDRYGGIYELAFSPDDKWLATADADDKVRVFSLPSGKRKYELKAGGQPLALAWSPDAKTLAWAGNYDSGTINLVTIADGKVTRLPSGHTLGVTTLAWSPDGTQIASGARDKTIRLRSARSN